MMDKKKERNSSSSSSSSRSRSDTNKQNNENIQQQSVPHQLSELEIRRLENIARNEAFLRSIGLADVQQSISEINQRDAAAAALNPVAAPTKKRQRSSNNKRTRSLATSSDEPIRRSTRGNSTIEIDGPSDSAANIRRNDSFGRRMPSNVLLDHDMTMDDNEVVRKKITAQSLRDFIEQHNVQHSELIKDKVYILYTTTLLIISLLAGAVCGHLSYCTDPSDITTLLINPTGYRTYSLSYVLHGNISLSQTIT